MRRAPGSEKTSVPSLRPIGSSRPLNPVRIRSIGVPPLTTPAISVATPTFTGLRGDWARATSPNTGNDSRHESAAIVGLNLIVMTTSHSRVASAGPQGPALRCGRRPHPPYSVVVGRVLSDPALG